MAESRHRLLTRAALILALTLVFQSLRFFIPLPPFFSTLLIGSLVNACLLVAFMTTGLPVAAAIAAIAPVVAYFQQLLLLPVFIAPVAVGNFLLVVIFRSAAGWGKWPGIILAAAGKTVFLYFSFTWLLTFVNVNPKLAAGIMFAMSWPQFATAVIGGVLATLAAARINRREGL